MNSPFLSIIIPVYNVEKHLHKCIDSVLCQSYGNFELILVDDGSPDKSPEICDEYAQKDSRIKVIHKQNEGVGVARNTGIDNANGEWILFIDSDDFVDQGYFQRGVDEVTKNGQLDCVIFPNIKENDSTGETCIIDNILNRDEVLSRMQLFALSKQFEISPCIFSKFYKRQNIYDHNVRFAASPVYEDVLFNIQYFTYTEKVLYINKCYCHYMIYPSAPSLTRCIKKPKDIMTTSLKFISVIKEIEELDAATEEDKRGMQNRFFKVASWGIRGIYQLESDKNVRRNSSNKFLTVYKQFKLEPFSSMWLRRAFLTLIPFAIKDYLLLKVCGNKKISYTSNAN